MKKFFLLFVTLSLCYFVTPAQAVFDPLAVPNNRVGVHILDPQEIHQAAKLVNSSGGSWGYVTIPIRSNDRDREKWIRFFDNAKKEKLIPIIRLATYPEGPAWVKPTPLILSTLPIFFQICLGLPKIDILFCSTSQIMPMNGEVKFRLANTQQ